MSGIVENVKLRNAKSKAQESGGSARIEKQHQQGKLTARERMNLLFDDGFQEIGAFVQHRASYFGMEKKKFLGDGVVIGYGDVYGRPVCAYAQDFTILGGSLGEEHAKKIHKIMDIALKRRIPVIGMNDSGGARIQEGVDALGGYGGIFQRNVDASGVIPQLSLIMGPCAGGAVYSPALTDFTIMVQNTSYMFLTGPDVIKKVTYEDVTQETLGGASVHVEKTGVADLAYINDVEALQQTKRLLSFLPQSNRDSMQQIESHDSIHREESSLNTLVPKNANQPYDINELIEKIIDEGDFFEIQSDFAKNIIIGFGRIDGYSVGIVANQPMEMSGCLDINASRKAARFIRFCDAFNIPLVSLVDVPGFLPGTDQEHNAVITHGAKLLYAYAEATVPKITVITRKAYGGAYIVMNSKHLMGDFNFSWPDAEIAVMGAEGAVEVIFKQYKNDPSKMEVLKQEYKEQFSSPFVAAARGYIDDIIEPRKTRSHVAHALRIMRDKQVQKPWRKHSNMPL